MKKIALPITIIYLFFTNCSEIDLQERPPSLLSPSFFFTSESDFQAALTGAFKPLYRDWLSFDYGYPLIMTSGAEDVRSAADIFKNLDRLEANDQDQSISYVWRQLYQSIANANAIIGNLKKAQGVSEKTLGEIEGQAKFIRAFSYFYLVRWFGKVQLTTFENQQNIDTLKESSVEDIYESIIANLKDAESKLPLTFAEKGRPTQGAAKSLLAKVYLTRAGWPLEEITYYDSAYAKSKEVIDAGTYQLEENFADLWKNEKKLTNTEFIFGFYGSLEGGGVSASHMHFSSKSGYEGGWSDFYSEKRFYDIFPEGVRKTASFTTEFTNSSGETKTWKELNIEPHIAKYRDAGKTSENNGEGFTVLLRYADVLLMYAEAANMIGKPQEALEKLNQVRQRAGLTPYTAPLSEAAFDKSVIEERNWELAFELNRWFDLVRKKMVVEVNKDVHAGVTENDRLLPKPAAQLIPGILTQNLGY